jgi:hypothetical protein
LAARGYESEKPFGTAAIAQIVDFPTTVSKIKGTPTDDTFPDTAIHNHTSLSNKSWVIRS